MSTLTSSQLNIKRSSTRLHAPPGGFSSFSFEHDPTPGTATRDKESLNPATANYVKYDHPSNNQCGDGGFYSMKAQPPYPIHHQYHATGPHQTENLHMGQPSAFFNAPTAITNQPPPTSNNYRWNDAGGAQPPLTSSKRDQNWEKKRRLWLAQKNTVGQVPSGGFNQHFMQPPAAMSVMSGSYSDSMGAGGAYNSPSSPLTKFVAQQTMKQHAPHGYDRTPPGTGAGIDDRPPASARPISSVPPRTAVASSDGYASRGYSNNSSAYSIPTTSSIPPRTAVGGTEVYSSHGRVPPGTGSSNSSSNWSRQPPGGQTNWSPYS